MNKTPIFGIPDNAPDQRIANGPVSRGIEGEDHLDSFRPSQSLRSKPMGGTEAQDVADALEEFAMIDEAEGGNPHVIATERRAAELLRLSAAIAVETKPVGDWVMVPREPTEAMLDNVVVRMDEEGFVPNDVAAEIYAAMLTAAPSPQPLLDAPVPVTTSAFTPINKLEVAKQMTVEGNADLTGTVKLPLGTEASATVVDTLKWYAEQARLCRLIHSEGDPGRWALSADGGDKARSALLELGITNDE